ncbi:hypothetical protein BDW62DRAFT_204519 [Aspergillus aurantiobrunneus]
MAEVDAAKYGFSTVETALADDSRSSSSYTLEHLVYATKAMLGRYIPEADPDHPRSLSLAGMLSKRTTMLRIQMGLAASVAVLNMVVWVWATATHDIDRRGVGTFFTGDCGSATTISSAAHLLLNGLSTLFLGAGNYCMQILAAPSRADVDVAHAQGDWLEIGVLSFRNLTKFPSRRVALWIGLGVISTVLHLVWNSTLFASVPFTIFDGAIATSDFLWATDRWNASTTEGSMRPMKTSYEERIYNLQDSARNFTRLDKLSCRELYVNSLKTTGDVILIAKNLTSAQNNGSSLIQGWINGLASWDYANFWVCGEGTRDGSLPSDYCTRDKAMSLADNWTIATWEAPHYQHVEIDYCLIGDQAANDQRCGFHFSSPAMGVVSVFTLVGSILIFLVGRTQKGNLMVTLGDAISSFLEEPEPLDKQKTDTQSAQLQSCFVNRFRGRRNQTVSPKSTAWLPRPSISWFHAVSKRRWILSYTFFLLGLGFVVSGLIVVLVSLSNQGIPISISEICKQGLGQANGFALLQGPWESGLSLTDFTKQALFTNGLQLLVSCAYLVFNNILSRQLVADEWVRLLNPQDKKSLRVSEPRGLQRDSYMLSMPFKYSVPMMVLFIALHWFVSQAIFIVQATVYQAGSAGVRMPEKDNSRIGYSALGIVLVVAVLVLLFCGLLAYSAVRRYRDVPLEFPGLGTCSNAVSAVCHPPKGDSEAYLFPVRMGVVKQQTSGQDGAGRLTMSTYVDLREPQEGSIIVQPVKEKLYKDHITKDSGYCDEETR